MESRRGSTWIRFNGGNGCIVSLRSNPLYGQRSPVIYGKKTDASEGSSGTQRWLDRFFWVMRRLTVALNSRHSPGSCWGWLSAAVLPLERKRMRTYFRWAKWKKTILMAIPQAKCTRASVVRVRGNIMGSPNSLEFIVQEPWMSARNVIPACPVAISRN